MASKDFINAGSASGIVDVVKDYSWSVSNSKLWARKEVPTIEITEFQQTVSSVRQAMEYWANQAKGLTPKGPVRDPYAGLYAVDKSIKGNSYIFPFYSTYHHNITNAWGENKGVIGEAGKIAADYATEIARTFFPSAGIESAKSWEGSQTPPYQFMFQLLNTVNPDVDIKNNKALIRALLNNNLLDKIDFISIRPPAICQIRIPGVRGTTVGVMSTISVENIGQINKIGKENIPDAYQIGITIQELLTESRQIFSDELKDGKVFADIKQTIKGIEDVKNTSVTKSINSFINIIKNAGKGIPQ